MTAGPDLELPLALKGSWEHALFLSYGLDLPFFERTILPGLPATCRNRILLGDEKTYLASCDDFADSGLVRHANSQYVAEPILRQQRSHAKVLLLTSSEAGWLAVGSGNVSMQGFASGGELFTDYSYASEDDGSLAEFVAVRLVLERFRDQGLLSRTAAWHVDRLLEGTPWLFRTPSAPSRVRHNLDTSFVDQLAEAVGDEHVDRLWVLAPFFDESAHALGELVKRLRPDATTILLQPGRTSVDPAALTKQAAAADGHIELRSVRRPDDPWIHAKLFVVQTSSNAVCLQGSANASVAALLLRDPDGNFEMGSLLRGSRDSFDDVLNRLDISDPVNDAAELHLSYQPSDEKDHLDDVGLQLTGAEWNNDILLISYRGVLPATAGLQLIVRGTALPVEAVEYGQPLILHFGDKARELLGGADPIRLQLADGNRSNAIFPCDRVSLNAALQASPESDERLSRIGHLDLDDDELELLLQELEATMVLDRHSLWVLAGKRSSSDQATESEEIRLDYSDVDYDMLRGHPRLRQYLMRSGGAGAHGRSRLQIVLNAITRSFADLLETASTADTAAAVAAVAAEGDAGAQAEDADGDTDAVEADRRRWSRQTRINVLFKNFIKRFLSGLTSPDYEDVVGPEVVTSNYVIFLHVLARLYERDWVDEATLVGATAATMEAMWGSEQTAGYVARLDPDDFDTVIAIVRERHSDGQLLALLYCFARDLRQAHLADRRIQIRDAWRALLLGGRVPLDRAVLRDAGVLLRPIEEPDGPLLSKVVEELRQLAEYRTLDELLDALNKRFGTSPGSWYFDKVTVLIPPRPDGVNVECLLINNDDVSFGVEDAQWTLAAWMQVEPRDYYRVQVRSLGAARSTRFVAFYEPALRRGQYAALGSGGESVALASLRSFAAPWDDAMLDLMLAAEQEDAERAPADQQASS